MKKAAGFAAMMASFSARSAVRMARIGPPGGGSAPYRLMSALLNGRSQANALPPTSQVWLAAVFLHAFSYLGQDQCHPGHVIEGLHE